MPHHGIDLAEPGDEFALAEFVASVGASLADVDARHARAVLVAGTGLYLRAITDPMDMPGRWPDVRAALERISGPFPAFFGELIVEVGTAKAGPAGKIDLLVLDEPVKNLLDNPTVGQSQVLGQIEPG